MSNYKLPLTPHESLRRAQRRQLLEERAWWMRRNPTPAEARLWLVLKGSRLGAPFRRQVVVGGRYIADFLARKERLIVEVDGGAHDLSQAQDARRDHYLQRLGFRTLRIPTEQVHADLPGVARRILEALG